MQAKNIILLTVLIVFLISCQQQQYVCPTGEIVLNQWECPEPKPELKHAQFDIKAKAQIEDLYSFKSVDWTTATKRETIKLEKIYGTEDYGVLGLHVLAESANADFTSEDIRCTVLEYYDSVLNGKETIDLKKVFSEEKNIQKGFKYYHYEANKKPKEVRFDIECKGIDSSYSDTASYYIDLVYLD